MDKLAIFVEGQTEQIFVEKLVLAIAGSHRVHIDTVKAFGGKNNDRAFVTVQAHRPDPAKRYYVLIHDSSNDSRVLSDLRDHYESLTSQGYKDIIALRDVHPQTAADIPTIRAYFEQLVKRTPIHPILVLAVLEIESWFIAEHTHFSRYHPRLVDAAVNACLRYDPATCDPEAIATPASDLNRVYALVGKGYTKSRSQVERTVDHLDYARYYVEILHRISELANLIAHINGFLS